MAKAELLSDRNLHCNTDYWTRCTRLFPNHMDKTTYTIICSTIPKTSADVLALVSHLTILQSNCVNLTQVCTVIEFMKCKVL
jgi:hypothetical protein